MVQHARQGPGKPGRGRSGSVEHLWRPLCFASLILLFLLEEGANLLEGGVGLEHGDEGLLLLKLLAEADEESVDEGAIVDVIAEFTKFVADSLDPLAENGDRGISLDGRTELGVEGVDARVGVVLEQLLERCPKLGGGGVVGGDQIEELRGDACVNPLDDGEIIFHPARIGVLRRVGWIYVVAEAAAAEVDVEEVAPMVVVVGAKI